MVDALNGVVALEALCEEVRVFTNSWHPNVQGAHPALKQIARMRVGCGSEVHLSHENLSDEVLRTDHGTAQNIGMAAKVLGRGVKNEVDSHVQRFAPPRRGEGVVDEEKQVVSLRNVGHRLDVADLEDGVGQRLDVQKFRVVLDGRFVGRWVAHVGHRGRNTKTREFLGQKTVGPTVNVGAGDHVIALVEQSHQRR